jgi:hypothetical protein
MMRNPPSKERRARAVRVGGALTVLGVGFGVWLFAVSDRSPNAATASKAEAVLLSAQDLGDVSTQTHHPVYWAGSIAGTSYEFTRTNDGRIYVRYLPEGVDAGDPRPMYTTVGTYPRPNAYSVLRHASTRPGAKAYDTTGGALVVTNTKTPTSAYFAFKNSPYLVEVFNPSAWKALQLTLSGQVRPIR